MFSTFSTVLARFPTFFGNSLCHSLCRQKLKKGGISWGDSSDLSQLGDGNGRIERLQRVLARVRDLAVVFRTGHTARCADRLSVYSENRGLVLRLICDGFRYADPLKRQDSLTAASG
jgi:hypothetical protein